MTDTPAAAPTFRTAALSARKPTRFAFRPDAETRAAMLATGMAEGMEASYARLDPLMGFA